MECPGLSLLLVPVLTAASDGKAPGAPESNPGGRASASGAPALFSWADFDGDGRLDLAAVTPDGELQLLASDAQGRFEDVSERAGLAGVTNVALVLWADYDADQRLDLFVGARVGSSRLFRNEASVFVDMTEGSGLVCEGAVQSADWLDHDGDGRPDLHVLTAERHELYRGLEGGFFERSELPLVGDRGATGPGGVPIGAEASAAPPAPGSSSDGGRLSGRASIPDTVRVDGVNPTGGRIALSPAPSAGGAAPLLPFPIACATSIRDQASPTTCLQASTTPTLGMLHPISSNLFVAVAGEVGIGTTSPAARLHVEGTARITDTVTLAPGGDQALDVSTGSIYKGGALFIHTKGGADNTAVGRDALASVTSGYFNTASGADALRYNTTGIANTASGADALRYNTTGIANTASGFRALRYNTTGLYNTASGFDALGSNTDGGANTASGFSTLKNNTTGNFNTASGGAALFSNTTGFRNTACGYSALNALASGNNNIAIGANASNSLTSGSNNIAIGNQGVGAESATIRIGTAGTHTRAFLAGIRGVTTDVANAIPVLVDSAGQLGTVSSSRRFKEEIRDMGDATERLLALRPVIFRYKPEVQAGERPLEYGLIAEEVAEVFPELVVYDEDGKPFTVKYHLLASMLLNELQELSESHGRFEERVERELAELRGRFAAGRAPETSAPVASAPAEDLR